MKSKILSKIPGGKEYKNSEKRKEKNSSGRIGLKSVFSDLTSTKSILFKMVLAFLLLIVVPVSVIGYVSVSTASNDLMASTEDSVRSATLQTSNYFDAFMAKAKDVSVQILASTLLQNFVNMNPDTADPVEYITAQQDALSVFQNINSSSSDLSVKLLLDTGTALGGLNRPDNMDKVFNAEWYKKVLKADGRPVWVDYGESMSSASAQSYAVSLVRLLKYMNTGKKVGIVIVDVNYKPVSDVLGSINLGKNDNTYLITSTGRVLSAKGKSEEEPLAAKNYIKEVKARSQQSDTGTFNVTDNGISYLVSYHKSPITELTAVTVVPYDKIIEGAAKISKNTIVLGVIFILAAVIIGFIFSLGMSIALKKIMNVMSKAESGDLTSRLSMKRRDEFGNLVASFNDMIGNISNLVTESKLAANEVAAASDNMARISSESARISNEIAHAIVEVASGASNQAMEIESSVRNVSQLAEKITLAVEKTRLMETDSESMKEVSEYGLATIGELNRKAAETNEITANVVKEISQLNQYVKNINVITQVLRGIADQTNLLALNAAIEAARAGDAGKGFAVVADEIRKLAEQSNNHTREIQKHIENIFKQAQSSTSLVQMADASIREQSEMVAKTAEAFSRINSTTAALAANINNVGGMISDMDSNKEMVLASMENISAVSEQVSASTQEVSASTQEQLASIEQLDDTAKKLKELAENLIRLMEKFKVQAE